MNLILPKIYLNLAKKALVLGVAFSILVSFLSPVLAQAQIGQAMVISNVSLDIRGRSATIYWDTNRKATGKVEYGLKSGQYTWSVNTNVAANSQAITISGLFPETDYYFRITAEDQYAVARTSEQRFKTTKDDETKAPVISNVSVVFTTGNTATIQWETDEDSTTEVYYGLTTSYGKTKIDSKLVRIHDITLTGLAEGTTYQFIVQSKDRNANTARWFNMNFRTNLTNKLDQDALEIFAVTPVSENDPNVSATSAVVFWRTNKLASGTVIYGETTNPGTRVATNPPRDFSHDVTLVNLKPATTYYYKIEVTDVLGKRITSNLYSFTTKNSTGGPVGTTPSPNTSSGSTTSGSTSSGTSNPNPQVLGASLCSINLGTDFGYYGAYYNLSSSDPDMNAAPGSSTGKIGRENYWYNDTYFKFDRVDPALEFLHFRPFVGQLVGDPFHFAVNFRAIINVPVNGNYTYTVASDDDSWTFIDGQLITDLGGLHKATDKKETITLGSGYHELEIFYADRRGGDATFRFLPDSRLKFHPLPLGCSIQDVLSYNKTIAAGAGYTTPGGSILGSSNTDDFGSGGPDTYVAVAPAYACNPNLGYTRIKALYRTTENPDIWALLETGQKHYITSPESFNMYQCDWSLVKTVSQNFLNQFANATLVKTPESSIVYHLFDRGVTQWLKINIPSPTIFVSYANNYWGNIARINHLDLVSYPNVKLIKGETNPTIYLIDGVNKKPFTSEAQFIELGYDWIEVATLNQPHLDSYKTIEAVQ